MRYGCSLLIKSIMWETGKSGTLWKLIVYELGVLGQFAPSDTFWSGTLGGFALKNQTRNNDKTHKDFWFFHAYFLCQNVRILSNYILFTQKINLFWSGSIRSIRNIKSSSCFTYFLIYILWQKRKNFELCQVFMCWIVLYILVQSVLKKSGKKKVLNYIKSLCIIFCSEMIRYSQRFLNYIKSSCFKQNVSILPFCIYYKHYSVTIDSSIF